ncbi:helix-turn-helix domain-containing protein [Bacteroides fragilis]|uniref:AraC family transcriptional regulator n=1 Tax=Bacteroides fragilis TaxID=817 RepID=A0A853PS42_BACFG|nr:helix-turn-helix domain-containing protein [Bacteroides fragilis]EYA38255.1 bacterial regulatory helix-turn-helix s, AraC family protein [Bacteroides fragilis str. 20793-3]MCS2359191.1 helix-turn-helix domain-containing protein [Bacteroides fragilis]OCR29458.1 AraC family transcriptional regulator [Bacteroides fragilis]PJY67661.1 Btr-like HTH-type transcriptional activator [Bacteroides fragilis]
MIEQQMPFRRILLTSDTFQILKEGQIISTFNKCGIFYCQRGSVEVSLEGYHYHIKPGDVYIYMASTLVHLLHKSEDAEGIMVEVDFYYILPIVNKVINVESQLFMRKNPCVSLSDEQCAHFEYLLNNLWDRINAEDCQKENVQYQHLKLELIKSMGQTICYEILNMYFTNQPLQPLQQGKKDVVFQNFMLSLFRFYRKERDVSFYARMQHITPRYFSAIIKEKTGDSALQWIVRMVITEAKQLLEESDLSIKEIADQLNFPTQSFFGKYFKQYVGVSPKEYRNNAATTRIKR